MKFNETYEQKILLKETIEITNHIQHEIIKFISARFNLLSIEAPLIVEEDDTKYVGDERVTRDAFFDLGQSHKIAKLVLSHSNWGRDMINKLDLEVDEGIYFKTKTLWRDKPENTHSSVSRHELTFQIKVNNDESSSLLESLTLDLYNIFISLSEKIASDYKIKNIYPKIPQFITSQQMDNELSNISSQQKEDEFALSELAFIMQNTGSYLFSGHRHAIIPPEIYNLNDYNQWIFKDDINTDAVKVGSISILASGNQLSDQLSIYGLADLIEDDFFKQLMQEKKYKVIEVKINIPRLAMILMRKGHISEVQPDVSSEEAKIIKTTHDIETY